MNKTQKLLRYVTVLPDKKQIEEIKETHNIDIDVEKFTTDQKNAHAELINHIHDIVRHSQILKQIPEKRHCLTCGASLGFDQRQWVSKKKVKINGKTHMEWRRIYCSNDCCVEYIQFERQLIKIKNGFLKGDKNTCDYALFKMMMTIPIRYYSIAVNSNFGYNKSFLSRELNNILKSLESKNEKPLLTTYIRNKLNINPNKKNKKIRKMMIPHLFELVIKS